MITVAVPHLARQTPTLQRRILLPSLLIAGLVLLARSSLQAFLVTVVILRAGLLLETPVQGHIALGVAVRLLPVSQTVPVVQHLLLVEQQPMAQTIAVTPVAKQDQLVGVER